MGVSGSSIPWMGSRDSHWKGPKPPGEHQTVPAHRMGSQGYTGVHMRAHRENRDPLAPREARAGWHAGRKMRAFRLMVIDDDDDRSLDSAYLGNKKR